MRKKIENVSYLDCIDDLFLDDEAVKKRFITIVCIVNPTVRACYKVRSLNFTSAESMTLFAAVRLRTSMRIGYQDGIGVELQLS